jgi:hypothetical protein
MKSTKAFAIAIIVLALSVAAFAAGPKIKKTVSFFSEINVAGTTLKAGEYTVVVEDGFATFSRDGKEYVKAAVQLQDAGHKFDGNEVITGENNSLKELGLTGTSTKLVIGAASAMPSGSGSGSKK